MRLEKIDNKILIWETGKRNNKIEYDSTQDKSNYRRKNLSFYEDFLRDNNEFEEADKIKIYLGKILKYKSIPKVTPVGSYSVSVGLDYLKETIDRYKNNYGLNLNPNFQRGHVWSMDQRIAFVEFILQGGKTNPIYFNHENWMSSFEGEFVIVDGKQRLTSLLMFLDNEFPVFKNLDQEEVGFYAKELDFFRNNFLTFVINDLKSKKLVLKWYLEMNKGNIQHTEEELNRVEKLLQQEIGKEI